MEEKRQKMLARLAARHVETKTSVKEKTEYDIFEQLAERASKELQDGVVHDETIGELEVALAMQHTAWTEKKLRDSLVALRKKQQEGSGQSAFSFQKKVEPKKEEKNGETAEPLQRKEVKVDDGNAVVRADLREVTENVTGEDGAAIAVAGVHHSRLFFLFRAQTGHVRDVNDSILVFRPLHTSLLVRDCHNLTLVVSAQQVRIHDCVGLKLFVRGAVILEQCREVEVGPYRVEGEADGDESWRQVKDFDFLGQGQSPNWRPLDQSEWRSFSLFSG